MEKIENLLPIFVSHYGLNAVSILTLDEAGKTTAGNPNSIIDIAKENKLSQVIVIDERIDGIMEAVKNFSKEKIQLVFGLKLTVVPDMIQKDDASEVQESSAIIFMKDSMCNPEVQSSSYLDLVKIHNCARNKGNYGKHGRIDWKTLKELWTPNLILALPYFSSFLSRNLLTFASIIPDLPCAPWIFKEIDSQLPFAMLIDEAIDKYATENNYQIQPVKTIYYKNSSDFESFLVFRARNNHGTFSSPRAENMCSDRFSWSAYKELSV